MCQLSNEGMQGSPAETLYKNNKEKVARQKNELREWLESILAEH